MERYRTSDIRELLSTNAMVVQVTLKSKKRTSIIGELFTTIVVQIVEESKKRRTLVPSADFQTAANVYTLQETTDSRRPLDSKKTRRISKVPSAISTKCVTRESLIETQDSRRPLDSERTRRTFNPAWAAAVVDT